MQSGDLDFDLGITREDVVLCRGDVLREQVAERGGRSSARASTPRADAFESSQLL